MVPFSPTSPILEPAIAELLWTTSASGLVLLGAAIALLALPWRDDEIQAVDNSFRNSLRRFGVHLRPPNILRSRIGAAR